jgi:hypothetical protein
VTLAPNTFAISTYTVRIIATDNQFFPRYQIFKLSKLIGTQRSMPTLSDCEWHAAGAVYATHSGWPDAHAAARASGAKNAHMRCFTIARRGRPTDAERLRKLAYVAEAEPFDESE